MMKKENVLLLIFLSVLVSGCKTNLPKFKLCATMEEVGLFCADQRIPDEKNGKAYPYKAGYMCMSPDDFKLIMSHMIDREKYIKQLESRASY